MRIGHHGAVPQDVLPTPERPSVLVHLVGELDLAAAPDLRTKLAGLLDQGERDVVVDLGGVTFFDTSALEPLVEGHHRGLSSGVRLVLCHIPPHVRRVLEITGLDRVLETR
ncbi:MAG: hypothetical protein AVDCRST_MAG20-697 [uncultured Acidimicrobiales bacterium]|uniref:Anti-sigma factor antagonist n=1 Tax=uncultured Acidimicrobiales bacterium TaxID=310071 RepID=A0A6J4HDH1_9ACTN|nr:MAG: hypothetical protein AVDCRST_MAG20-697 [uncultured Acidimicrobiales bacterium]